MRRSCANSCAAGWPTRRIDVVISNGGTGVTDCMPEAAAALIEHDIPGFATLFQVLSLQDIGSSGMLSRASAGLAGGKLLFLLPGSENGSRLAMQRAGHPAAGHHHAAMQPGRIAGR